MRKDNLGDRMKSYENITRTYLPGRMPVIIRIDGKAFHTFTKGLEKPFDKMLNRVMQDTAKYLCKNIEGVKLAYTQSDEISLLITNNDNWETCPWFGNNLQKMVSVAASMATMAFNKYFAHEVIDGLMTSFNINDMEWHDKLVNIYHPKLDTAMFDARVFVLPADEVCNYFIWRQQDAIRNSIQSMGQAHFSHKELMNKNCENIKQMLVEKNLKWESIPVSCQRGICVVKKPTKVKTQIISMKTGTHMEMTRNRWTVDDNIPLFWEDRKYIDSLFNHGGENYIET